MGKAAKWSLIQFKANADAVRTLGKLAKAWNTSVSETIRRSVAMAWDPFATGLPMQTPGGASVVETPEPGYNQAEPKKPGKRARKAAK